jgi:hypothetical protein
MHAVVASRPVVTGVVTGEVNAVTSVVANVLFVSDGVGRVIAAVPGLGGRRDGERSHGGE